MMDDIIIIVKDASVLDLTFVQCSKKAKAEFSFNTSYTATSL